MKRVKVFFSLEQDEEGYPPFGAESLWAFATEGGYRVDSIPFYARAVAFGDVVAASKKDGVFWYERTLSRSDNSLLRVVAYGGAGMEKLESDLEALGCTLEADPARHLVAVSVPKSAPLDRVQAYLAEAHSLGLLDYEEPILRGFCRRQICLET